MKIDYISDLHLDFHIPYSEDPQILYETTTAFLASMLPEILGNVLVIAGDLSHYNQQSVKMLTYFAQHYPHVIWVLGNHDYYVISKQEHLYGQSSQKRVDELKHLLKHEQNIHLLERYNTIAIEGKIFAGATNWYALEDYAEIQFFKRRMNDSELIQDFDIRLEHLAEKKGFRQMKHIDVCITHVPPIFIKSHGIYGHAYCYVHPFNLQATYYIFGHCHEQSVYERADWKFYINAVGYPTEHLPAKIRSFTIDV